jgi:hypothetical protein
MGYCEREKEVPAPKAGTSATIAKVVIPVRTMNVVQGDSFLAPSPCILVLRSIPPSRLSNSHPTCIGSLPRSIQKTANRNQVDAVARLSASLYSNPVVVALKCCYEDTTVACLPHFDCRGNSMMLRALGLF